MRLFSLLILALLLAGCDTPINHVRTQRFGDGVLPQVIHSTPRAVALALQATPDGQGLSAESLHEANALLTRQGRIDAQVLTLTPLTPVGQALAPRLAQALQRAGAQAPQVLPLSEDPDRLAQAATAGWDLELQSESLTPDLGHCGLAQPERVTVHPFYGIGALGCANRANLARMVSDPRDLGRPRVLTGGDGKTAAAAVERYQGGQTRELIDINFDN